MEQLRRRSDALNTTFTGGTGDEDSQGESGKAGGPESS